MKRKQYRFLINATRADLDYLFDHVFEVMRINTVTWTVDAAADKPINLGDTVILKRAVGSTWDEIISIHTT